MKLKKNLRCLLIIAAVLAVMFVGCGKDDDGEKFTITYNANAANFSGKLPASVSVNAGESVKLATDNEYFNRWNERISLDGWNTKDNGSGTDYGVSQVIVPTQSMTLYAQWKPFGVGTVEFYVGSKIYVGEYFSYNGFKATIDTAVMIIKYPTVYAVHDEYNPRILRHSAGEYTLGDPDGNQSICETYAVDLLKPQESYLGNIEGLDEGFYGDPYVRVFCPCADGKNADLWWELVKDVDTPSKQILKEKDAGYYFAGKIEVDSTASSPAKTYAYELVGKKEIGPVGVYWEKAANLNDKETLSVKFRPHIERWFEVLEKYKVYEKAQEMAREERIVFSDLTLKDFLPSVALPAGKTLMDLIYAELDNDYDERGWNTFLSGGWDVEFSIK